MEILLAKMELPKEFHPFNLELPREFHPFNLELLREFHPFNLVLPWEFHPFNLELPWEFHPFNLELPMEFQLSILSTWNYPRNSICMKGVPMLSRIWDTHTTYIKASFFRWNFINPDFSQLLILFNINNSNIHYIV